MHAGSWAVHIRDTVIPAMEDVRDVADRLEKLVADDLWPLPKYRRCSSSSRRRRTAIRKRPRPVAEFFAAGTSLPGCHPEGSLGRQPARRYLPSRRVFMRKRSETGWASRQGAASGA